MIIYSIKAIIYVLAGTTGLIVNLISGNSQNQSRSQHTIIKNVYNANDNRGKNKKSSWKDEQFDREANLWGLSKNDRRIAKQERMSPADYIEAEERDDDDLIDDDF
jgi:hypothetical protein